MAQHAKLLPRQTSMIFDIRLPGHESDGYLNYHYPVLAPLPIRPIKLRVSGIPTQTGLEMREVNIDLCILACAGHRPSLAVPGDGVRYGSHQKYLYVQCLFCIRNEQINLTQH